MRKIIRLTENDLKRIVKRVLREEIEFNTDDKEFGQPEERDDYRVWSYSDPLTQSGMRDIDFNPEEWEDEYYETFEDWQKSDIYSDPRSADGFSRGRRTVSLGPKDKYVSDKEYHDVDRREFNRHKENVWGDKGLRVSRRKK